MDMQYGYCKMMNIKNYKVAKPNLVHVMHCAIWYHLYNLKNVKNAHGRKFSKL